MRGRTARRLLALFAVLVAAIPMTMSTERVVLTIDGEEVEYYAYAATVGEFLGRRDIDVAPNDLVIPPTDTALSDGMSIEIRRAEPVLVYVQGKPRTIEMAPVRVADVLDALDLTHVPSDAVTPAPGTPWQEGTVIRVVVPLAVSVVADGITTTLEVPTGIVADALAAARVEVGDSDHVSPPIGATLGSGMTISVTRVAFDEIAEERTIPFDEEVRETDDLYVGDQRIVQQGREGLEVDIFRIVLEDGVEVARELVRTEVAVEPLTRIVEVGTAQRPTAPSVPSGSVWDDLAQCESNGNWAARGTYHGGLQFHPDTWTRWKLDGYPQYAYQATREQQIAVGQRLQRAQGWYPWPHCARELGLL